MSNPRESAVNRAVIVTFSASMYQGKKKDKRVAADASEKYGLGAGARINPNKTLMKDAVAPIIKVYHRAYAYHKYMSLPWGDGTARILPASRLIEYKQQMNQYEEEFYRAVDNMIADYAVHLNNEQIIWNGLFRIEDYHKSDALRRKYSFSVHIDPIPQAGDFRIDLGDAAINSLREKFESDMNTRLQAAMGEAWQSLYDQLVNLKEIVTGNPKGIKEPTFTALSKLCSLLTDLNITNDPQLEAMRSRVEGLFCKPDMASEIRAKTDAGKASVEKEIADMMKIMEGYMGGAPS